MPSSAQLIWDATLEVDVLMVNRGTEDLHFPLGEKVKAQLTIGGQRWPVTLYRERAAPAISPPGGFITVRYHASLPPEAHGRAVLELTEPALQHPRAVIDIVGGGVDGPTVTGAWNGDFDQQRQLFGRLSIHNPIYIIVGPKSPSAKFQISFKYRIASLGGDSESEPPHSLQVAYTQRSFWQLGPFYDTSYMPEIMYQWEAPRADALHGGGVTWLGLQAGWLHESNGRGNDPDERSANIAYVRPLFSIGDPAGWHARIAPEFWFYFFGLHSNPDLYIYRGNSALRATVGKGSGASLTLTLLPGGHFSHGSRQLDLSIPVRLPWVDFSAYVTVQYFDGYAESLLDYRQHTSALRAGIGFVR